MKPDFFAKLLASLDGRRNWYLIRRRSKQGGSDTRSWDHGRREGQRSQTKGAGAFGRRGMDERLNAIIPRAVGWRRHGDLG